MKLGAWAAILSAMVGVAASLWMHDWNGVFGGAGIATWAGLALSERLARERGEAL